MEKMPALPPKPRELAELETRLRAIRTESQEVDAEIKQIQTDDWRRQTRENTDLDEAAERLIAGELETAPDEIVPERLATLRSRLELLHAADRKLSGRIAEQTEAHYRQIGYALRPLHREAVRRVHRALLELESANAEEAAVRGRVPGARVLQPMSFPNLGSSAVGGGPLRFWLEFARREGFLDDPEAGAKWPSAAF